MSVFDPWGEDGDEVIVVPVLLFICLFGRVATSPRCGHRSVYTCHS